MPRQEKQYIVSLVHRSEPASYSDIIWAVSPAEAKTAALSARPYAAADLFREPKLLARHIRDLQAVLGIRS
jgi:hypothetical protein